jgi:uncharacterized protein
MQKDKLQPIEIIRKFADTFRCKLTVSQNSGHPFMNPADASVVSAWLEENISADS